MKPTLLLGLVACASSAWTTASAQQQPTAAELSRTETPAKAIMRTFGFQEYDVRSAAEALPEDKWDLRPITGAFKNEKPEYGPAEMRTFREQVKHVGRANFAFSAELDGTKPPAACDKGGPSPANSRTELLTYLRDSFAALNKSINAITLKNMFDPIEGPYGGPNTRLGLAEIAVWHAADHYGQMTLYLRLNGIVPPIQPESTTEAARPVLRRYSVWGPRFGFLSVLGEPSAFSAVKSFSYRRDR